MTNPVRTMSETERAASERLTRELDAEIDRHLTAIPEGRIALIREAFRRYEAQTTDPPSDRLAIFTAGWNAAWKHRSG